MTDDRLEARLEAVERALTGGETAVADLEDAAALRAGLAEGNERLDDLEERVTELEAATQALRGYVGNVRQVNEEVERRADAALAKVQSLEDRVADLEGGARPRETDPGSVVSEPSGGSGSAEPPGSPGTAGSSGSPQPGEPRSDGAENDPLAELVERVRESL